jgi:pimeloyl-ACP methyl ester carboxylesterase
MFAVWDSEPNISKQQLSEIQCPVLVVSGDDDMISLQHTQELYEALPLGQLAVLPGTSHALAKEKPDLFNAIMMQFLEDLSYPTTMVPNRRTNSVSNQPE